MPLLDNLNLEFASAFPHLLNSGCLCPPPPKGLPLTVSECQFGLKIRSGFLPLTFILCLTLAVSDCLALTACLDLEFIKPLPVSVLPPLLNCAGFCLIVAAYLDLAFARLLSASAKLRLPLPAFTQGFLLADFLTLAINLD